MLTSAYLDEGSLPDFCSNTVLTIGMFSFTLLEFVPF